MVLLVRGRFRAEDGRKGVDRQHKPAKTTCLECQLAAIRAARKPLRKALISLAEKGGISFCQNGKRELPESRGGLRAARACSAKPASGAVAVAPWT